MTQSKKVQNQWTRHSLVALLVAVVMHVNIVTIFAC
jgi:hypothetical protein